MTVAVLFARADSIYKTIPGCDVYDIERDALTWPGGYPVVAHPPCRAWGQLSHFAKPRPGEKELAIWAIGQVRQWGGVLEHPRSSRLWKVLELPMGEETDEFGGFTLCVDQFWWGHLARKKTLLYCAGLRREDLPAMPIMLGEAACVVSTSKVRYGKPKPEISKAEREQTPPALAKWLVELASRANRRLGVVPVRVTEE